MVNDSSHLLYSGGWSEQPDWLIEAIAIYKAALSKHAGKGKNGAEKN